MIEEKIIQATLEVVKSLYGLEASRETVQLQKTRKEFEGDITLVVFPFTKASRKGPEPTAQEIGESLKQALPEISKFSIVKGFLNLVIAEAYWLQFMQEQRSNPRFGFTEPTGDKPWLIEFSSPNTNKPLHLGHVRNNLLGWSVSKILEADGKKVVRVNLVNDRGIHICKSMLAWKNWGNGETPESSGLKGDKLVGKYYVLFEEKLKEEALSILNNAIQIICKELVDDKVGFDVIQDKLTDANFPESVEDKQLLMELVEKELKTLMPLVPAQQIILSIPYESQKVFIEIFKKRSRLLVEAQELLRSWEAGDPETLKLWNMMNAWVYAGFDVTYHEMGISFDKTYYESQTYLLGKQIVEAGEQQQLLKRKADGSVWADLTDEGLDEKLLLRSDGTSVYMTQDLGTAKLRYDEYLAEKMLYVVGNEQNYHFSVLKKVLAKLGFPWSDTIQHVSYGMVELPEGKMKSREGTVVDADELMADMKVTAQQMTEELGKTADFSAEEAANLYRMIGLGALKYFILKVDPEKNMLFNPEESIDFDGNTGPFIQYTHARICSLLKRGAYDLSKPAAITVAGFCDEERDLLLLCHEFPSVVKKAAGELSPAQIANYVYEITRSYNTFYQKIPVLKEEDEAIRGFRLGLSAFTGHIIKECMKLLGIEVPERM